MKKLIAIAIVIAASIVSSFATDWFTTDVEGVKLSNENTTYSLPYNDGKKMVLSAPSVVERENEVCFKTRDNTDVCVARDGVISHIERAGKVVQGKVYNNYVVIDHGDKTFARYINLDAKSIKIKVGQKVFVGQVIAKTGSVSAVSAPNLRFYVSYMIKGKDGKAESFNLPIHFKIDNQIVILEKGKSY